MPPSMPIWPGSAAAGSAHAMKLEARACEWVDFERGGDTGTTPPLHPARWPVRPHLRPRPWRRIYTELHADLTQFPGIADGLNIITADLWAGEGRPVPGWDEWDTALVPLADALALPVAGEAMTARAAPVETIGNLKHQWSWYSAANRDRRLSRLQHRVLIEAIRPLLQSQGQRPRQHPATYPKRLRADPPQHHQDALRRLLELGYLAEVRKGHGYWRTPSTARTSNWLVVLLARPLRASMLVVLLARPQRSRRRDHYGVPVVPLSIPKGYG